MFYQGPPGLMVDLAQPSPNGVDVLYSHEYVAERMQTHPYIYARNNPLKHTDPSGLAVPVAACVLAGFGLAELIAGLICDSLYEKAVGNGKITPDPGLSKKHCYVSCCLNKANLWVAPHTVGGIGVIWEVKGGFFTPSDMANDLLADFYGIFGSYLNNCATLCEKSKPPLKI